MGPPKVATAVMRLYAGLGVFWPLREKGRASSAELSKIRPIPPLYSPRLPLRLLPKAKDCANGEAPPLS